MQDDRTPGGPEDTILLDEIYDLASSIAIGHLSRVYEAQFETIRAVLAVVIDETKEDFRREKNTIRTQL